MKREFQQTTWDEGLGREWNNLLALAVAEDLGVAGDLTSLALVPAAAMGRAAVVARRPGVLAGEAGAAMTLTAFDRGLRWTSAAKDGQAIVRGQVIGRIEGPARAMLAAERPLLNFLGRLSGIASHARRYVDAVAGTPTRIYDTRKTTPGWRKLEKYAVRCGGGCNHRAGLFEAVLIKDNHLALGAELSPRGLGGYSPAEAVVRAREFLESHLGPAGREVIVEIEVDTLAQFDEVIAVGPDLVLLDNMAPAELREAVARRDARSPSIELEASGGIDLGTVRATAEAGVDRISVGALTHSAVSLDFGLDWGA
jgi:nicotinate-nucleotide pyrophosphorylase (carboxylating)